MTGWCAAVSHVFVAPGPQLHEILSLLLAKLCNKGPSPRRLGGRRRCPPLPTDAGRSAQILHVLETNSDVAVQQAGLEMTGTQGNKKQVFLSARPVVAALRTYQVRQDMV